MHDGGLAVIKTLFSAAMIGFLSLPALAEGLVVEQRAEIAVNVVMETGETVEELRPAELVSPGQTVVFTVHYENQLDSAAENIALHMPVPEEMIFVQGSADHDGVETLYSIDGADFFAWDELTIIDDAGERHADPSEVRMLKWVFVQPVAANTENEISFRAILK